jgi:hypothetical protein
MQIEEFRQQYSGFAREVFEVLYDQTNVELNVQCSAAAALTAVLERCPRLVDAGLVPSDVVEVITSLPLVEVRPIQNDQFTVKFPHLHETSMAELRSAFSKIDDQVLDTVWRRTYAAPTEPGGQKDQELTRILEDIEHRDEVLDDLAISVPAVHTEWNSFVFLVARQWNSWTPSLFPIPGGCYALISPNFRESVRDGQFPAVIVIDPGFRFLEVLRERFGIGAMDIDAVLISHFHPDHVGGLFEYLALRHTIYMKTKRKTHLWLNATTRKVFGKLSAAFETSTLTPDKPVTILENVSQARSTRSEVIVKPFAVHHWELGNEDASLGFAITISEHELSATGGLKQVRFSHEIAIAGDTAYFPNLADNIHQADVLVLHLGSFRRKASYGRAKHLYYQGLVKVLEDCGARIRASGRVVQKMVLISEIGLEHAELKYLRKQCSLPAAVLPDTLGDQDYLGYIEQFVRQKIATWGDAHLARFGTQVVLGDSISVESSR